MKLFHGSRIVVDQPRFGAGNPRNDYGLGFYCTESYELACEWACPDRTDGFVNECLLDESGLAVCDLDAEPYGTLHWLAVLVGHRGFNETTPLMSNMKRLLLDRYDVDLQEADVVIGYRADDSYFSFARAFLDNRISLRQLERAMRLGGLGKQVVIRSERAFSQLSFLGATAVPADIWNTRRMSRDREARSEFAAMVQAGEFRADDVFALDLLRGR